MTLLQILVILIFLKLLSGTFSYPNQIGKLKPIYNTAEFSLKVDILNIYDDNIDENSSPHKSLIDEQLETAIFTAVIISNKNHFIAQSDKTVLTPPPK